MRRHTGRCAQTPGRRVLQSVRHIAARTTNLLHRDRETQTHTCRCMWRMCGPGRAKRCRARFRRAAATLRLWSDRAIDPLSVSHMSCRPRTVRVSIETVLFLSLNNPHVSECGLTTGRRSTRLSRRESRVASTYDDPVRSTTERHVTDDYRTSKVYLGLVRNSEDKRENSTTRSKKV